MDELDNVSTEHLTVERWTRKLSQSTGVPGGGAGSAVMLSMAAALTSMVAGYSEDSDAGAAAINRRGQALRGEALGLADQDAANSKAFGQAFHAPHGPARNAAICDATLQAARSSAAIGQQAAAAIEDLQWLAEHGNPALVADIVVALGALRASISGSRANLGFDISTLQAHAEPSQPAGEAADLLCVIEDLERALASIDKLSADIDTRIRERLADD